MQKLVKKKRTCKVIFRQNKARMGVMTAPLEKLNMAWAAIGVDITEGI